MKEFPPYDNVNFNDAKFTKLKNKTIPKSLFKYTSTKHIKSILLDDLMYLPRTYELNDPYEGELLYDSEKIKNTYRKHNLEYLKSELFKNESFRDMDKEDLDFILDLIIDARAPNSIEQLKEYLEYSVSVLCFSKTNKINSLWAHYADNHRGICIEYNIPKCDIQFIKDFCFEVEYIKSSDTTSEINNYFEESYVDLNLMIKPLLKKSEDWSYEEEWRIILHDHFLSQNHNNYYSNKHYIRFIKPEAVYMGFKISENDEKLIKDICKIRDIDLFKAKKDTNNYKFDFEKIELLKIVD